MTISCAVQEQGGAGTVMLRVHQSPRRQQKNWTLSDPASTRGKRFHLRDDESNLYVKIIKPFNEP